MTELLGWQNFYVIVGSSAGALIGLQFVVLTLIADVVAGSDAAQVGSAFGTPTVVHFGAVVLLAGIQCAPWPGITSVAIAWGAMGLAGLIYLAIVLWKMLSQDRYHPEFEDWLFHALLPLVAYGTLVLFAIFGRGRVTFTLFAIGGVAMLLLFIGIHNAWDAVTYHVYHQRKRRSTPEA